MNGVDLLANLNTITARGLLLAATEMETPRATVLDARQRFLNQNLDQWSKYPGWFPQMLCRMIRKELVTIKAMYGRDNSEEITPADIVTARSVPFSELIHFDREGKTLARCHEDKRPSLTWDRKRNTVKCWPCDKRWDTIAWVQEYNGLKFPQAVRYLLGK